MVRSRIRRIIEHLLNLAYSPAQQLRFDWMHRIVDGRGALDDKLSPRLRRDVEANLEKLYTEGRRQAALALRRFGEEQAAEAFPDSEKIAFRHLRRTLSDTDAGLASGGRH